MIDYNSFSTFADVFCPAKQKIKPKSEEPKKEFNKSLLIIGFDMKYFL